MFVADPLPSVDVHSRRSRRHSPRRSFLRRLKQNWRRTKLRKVLVTLIISTAAVIGGYKATMYVVGHQVNLQEFQQ